MKIAMLENDNSIRNVQLHIGEIDFFLALLAQLWSPTGFGIVLRASRLRADGVKRLLGMAQEQTK